jgi:hypothetical protein
MWHPPVYSTWGSHMCPSFLSLYILRKGKLLSLAASSGEQPIMMNLAGAIISGCKG